ncbi:peptidoglycan D,D-transpeptidase FtsI family protein [Scatolibacter rhodanostii]|uniref:peptidoglycan D,D-transpeptidase FtsI family protein n=1 Tax=Scatolibacter rhodanostii TaxID=2014781 RepID=UPI0013563962|nr:penicillin-binding protein 2 [Scatolibacter rhodanostii]
MKKRSYGLYMLLIFLLGMASWSMARTSTEKAYLEAANQQGAYKLTVTSSRGMIYDRDKEPLVNREEKTVAAVAPSVEILAQLNASATAEERKIFASYLESGKPFLYTVGAETEYENIDVFNITSRYTENQIAPHIIGYTDSTGNGVSGIELAMNDVLMRNYGEIAVYYQTDALGRVIPGASREIVDTTERSKAGVVLTLDGMIQNRAEILAEKLGKGSIIVTEVPNNEIRGLASVPDYSPVTLGEVMNREDSPLVNRALSAYSPGSVFKLAVAAQAIESGLDGFIFNCKGFATVNGMNFHCFNNIAHGKVDLLGAIENSCNAYFIHLGERIGASPLLSMTSNLGFGKSLTLAEGLTAAQGNLPTTEELQNERAFANFSFGQGSVTVTPLQVAAMVNTIASGGEYAQPKLIEGVVNDSLDFIDSYVSEVSKVRIMQTQTAEKLQEAMEQVVESGTGERGKPKRLKAGAKTGTAQTGIYEEGEEKNHYWYAGYVCDDTEPRYVIVIMRESVVDDKGLTASLFKEMADYLETQI